MSKLIWPVIALLSLAACDDNSNVRISSSDTENSSALRVIDALQCPSDQGVLTRRGTASDGGQTCTYAGPRGAEVKLHLVALGDNTVDEVLHRFQNEISPNSPQTPHTASVERSSNGNERAQVRLPGLSVDSDGDRATVKLPGMKIEADGDRANIRIGGLVIRSDDKNSNVIASDENADAVITADKDGATIRTSSTKSIRATLMNVMSTPSPDGWRVVGYEARGPSGGPIVIATYRSRDRDSQDIIDAAKALVTVNVGD